MSSFGSRLWGALRLNSETYEEVEADESADGQALMIFALAAVADGVARITELGLKGVVVGTFTAGLAWYIWAWVALKIGTSLLSTENTSADHRQLLRTLGFATAPGCFKVLAVVPGLAGPALTISFLWMFAAMVVAIRQALDYRSTPRAIAVVAIGVVPFLILTLAIMLGLSIVLSPFGIGELQFHF